MKQVQFLLIGLVATSLLGAGCQIIRTNTNTTTDQVQVVGSFYPLAYLAEQVGGEYVTVTTIVPNGVEPHDFAPTPRDIVAMTQADILLYNGAGLDAWAADIAPEDFTKADVQRISATAATDTDPHVWLDPVRMQDLVSDIRDAYSAVDPDHASDYQAQANTVIKQLQDLDANYQAQLANCELNQVIVAHDAFTYVADRYHIEILPILGINPNETPSAQTLVELTKLAQANHITYIFFEELTSPKLSETLAAEVGAETLVLSPLEGLSEEEQAAGDDYFTVSKRNLANLTLAMRCQ